MIYGDFGRWRQRKNKANSKTEVRRQNTEDSKISAKSTTKLRFSVPNNFFYNCRESSTNRLNFKKQSQFEKTRMSANIYKIRDYVNCSVLGLQKNKAKTKPISNQKAKMNVSFFKKDYENNRGWTLVGLSAMVNGIIRDEVVKSSAGSVLLLRLIDGSAMYL